MALVKRNETIIHDAKESKKTVMPYAFSILGNWPAGHFFRKYVDGKLQLIYQGKLGYDTKERNSSKGMMQGIAFHLNNPYQKRDSDFLKKLHKVVFNGITLSSGQRSDDVARPGQFRTNHTHIPIGRDNASYNGLVELCKQIANGQSQGYIISFNKEQYQEAIKTWNSAIEYYNDKIEKHIDINKDNYIQQATDIFKSTREKDPGNISLVYIPFKPKKILAFQQEIGPMVDAVLHYHNEKLGSFDNIFDIVDHVVDTGIELERKIHPFVDGNCRTIVTLLVNDSLMQMGIPFSCLFDPNRFDFYSKKEVVNEIFRGINMTLHAFIEPERSYYRFNPVSLVNYRHHIDEESTFMKTNTKDTIDSKEFTSSDLNQLRLLAM